MMNDDDGVEVDHPPLRDIKIWRDRSAAHIRRVCGIVAGLLGDIMH